MFDRIQSLQQAAPRLLLLVLAALLLFYAWTQPQISLSDGHPYDAESYYRMAQQVASGQPVAELRPFASRVALPWLVGTLFPERLMTGFTVLNLLFALAGLWLLRLYLHEFLRSEALVLGLLILLVSSANSPFRFIHFLPAYSDPPALFFMTLLLLLQRRIRAWNVNWALLLAGIGLVGALFRELVICAVLVVCFCQAAELQRRPPFVRLRSLRAAGLALLPLVATLAGIGLANGLVESTGEYRYQVQMLGVLRQLWQQASIYPLAWLTAFGVVPVIVLLSVDRRLLAFLGKQQDVTLYLAGMGLLAASAGFHTDRLVFWAYPALLVVFGRVIESRAWADTDRWRKVLFFAPLIVVQALASRALLPIPDDLNGALQDPGAAPLLLFSVYGEGANLGHFYASTMVPGDRELLLFQFLAAAVYFALVLHVRPGDHQAPDSQTPSSHSQQRSS